MVNVLIVITDGDARDDTDEKRMARILLEIEDKFDFVIPVGVGPNYNEVELAKIRGKKDLSCRRKDLTCRRKFPFFSFDFLGVN